MEIHRDGTNGAILMKFPKSELAFVVQLLKSIYQVTRLSFIREAFEDFEQELRPRLTLVVHNHLCQKCYRMINDKEDNFYKMDKDGDVTYRHKICPPLKENRP